jgi:hypothetical protein
VTAEYIWNWFRIVSYDEEFSMVGFKYYTKQGFSKFFRWPTTKSCLTVSMYKYYTKQGFSKFFRWATTKFCLTVSMYKYYFFYSNKKKAETGKPGERVI